MRNIFTISTLQERNFPKWLTTNPYTLHMYTIFQDFQEPFSNIAETIDKLFRANSNCGKYIISQNIFTHMCMIWKRDPFVWRCCKIFGICNIMKRVYFDCISRWFICVIIMDNLVVFVNAMSGSNFNPNKGFSAEFTFLVRDCLCILMVWEA